MAPKIKPHNDKPTQEEPQFSESSKPIKKRKGKHKYHFITFEGVKYFQHEDQELYNLMKKKKKYQSDFQRTTLKKKRLKQIVKIDLVPSHEVIGVLDKPQRDLMTLEFYKYEALMRYLTQNIKKQSELCKQKKQVSANLYQKIKKGYEQKNNFRFIELSQIQNAIRWYQIEGFNTPITKSLINEQRRLLSLKHQSFWMENCNYLKKQYQKITYFNIQGNILEKIKQSLKAIEQSTVPLINQCKYINSIINVTSNENENVEFVDSSEEKRDINKQQAQKQEIISEPPKDANKDIYIQSESQQIKLQDSQNEEKQESQKSSSSYKKNKIRKVEKKRIFLDRSLTYKGKKYNRCTDILTYMAVKNTKKKELSLILANNKKQMKAQEQFKQNEPNNKIKEQTRKKSKEQLKQKDHKGELGIPDEQKYFQHLKRCFLAKHLGILQNLRFIEFINKELFEYNRLLMSNFNMLENRMIGRSQKVQWDSQISFTSRSILSRVIK